MVAGKEASPKDVQSTERLKIYWTKGEGLSKWAEADHPWTELHRHLVKFMPDHLATLTATRWFFEVFHFYPGSDMNRVTHGKPPKGKVVGPG